ncbi:hypothetical protein IWZ01DRAFT_480490 [Phyllosticta capitalensis]
MLVCVLSQSASSCVLVLLKLRVALRARDQLNEIFSLSPISRRADKSTMSDPLEENSRRHCCTYLILVSASRFADHSKDRTIDKHLAVASEPQRNVKIRRWLLNSAAMELYRAKHIFAKFCNGCSTLLKVEFSLNLELSPIAELARELIDQGDDESMPQEWNSRRARLSAMYEEIGDV